MTLLRAPGLIAVPVKNSCAHGSKYWALRDPLVTEI
jgi:hypothetical protein